MMMITATILETGPSIDWRICWSGCSHGMLDPAANAGVVARAHRDGCCDCQNAQVDAREQADHVLTPADMRSTAGART